MDEDDRIEDCTSCSGTGISPTGRVEDSCSSCKGRGYIELEPDDYEPDEPDYDDYYYEEMADRAASDYEDRIMDDSRY